MSLNISGVDLLNSLNLYFRDTIVLSNCYWSILNVVSESNDSKMISILSAGPSTSMESPWPRTTLTPGTTHRPETRWYSSSYLPWSRCGELFFYYYCNTLCNIFIEFPRKHMSVPHPGPSLEWMSRLSPTLEKHTRGFPSGTFIKKLILWQTCSSDIQKVQIICMWPAMPRTVWSLISLPSQSLETGAASSRDSWREKVS